MGLGSKLKEAFSSDKSSHAAKSTNGSQRRKTMTPGAYPESTVDVPRTNRADTWDQTATTIKDTAPVSPEDNISEGEETGEYTHTSPLAKNNTTAMPTEPDAFPSPDSRVAGDPSAGGYIHDGRQYPYWGNVNKAQARTNGIDTRDDTVSPDSRIGGYPTGHSADRQNSVRASHDTARDPGLVHADDQFDGPVGNVNRGQPRMVEDDAARAQSMAISHLSQPTDYDSEYKPSGLHHNAADYSVGRSATVNHQYENSYGAQRTTGAENNRAINGAGRDTFGAPAHNGTGVISPQPTKPSQTWPKANTAMAMSSRAGPVDEPYSPINGANGDDGTNGANGFAPRERNEAAYKTGNSATRDANYGSPLGGSENGSAGFAQLSNDHYGPGHSGAKVLHRCQHCGNDNDITKYFSKDVVYRLS
jgi:hypothetical protein